VERAVSDSYVVTSHALPAAVCAEGELEVSQKDKILGVISAGRAFGELAVLYNCQRTASVRGSVFLFKLPFLV
jgi:hypothetical protein